MKKCPICERYTLDYREYYDNSIIVERHGYCDNCGYLIAQCYCEPVECFLDTVKGWKDGYGIYHMKNTRKHKRIRKKSNYRYLRRLRRYHV